LEKKLLDKFAVDIGKEGDRSSRNILHNTGNSRDDTSLFLTFFDIRIEILKKI